MQEAHPQYLFTYPPWVGMILVLILIGTPYLMLAVTLRRTWGLKGLVGLGAVVAAMLLWIIFTDHSVPNRLAVWGTMATMFVGFVAAPFTAIELVSRTPSTSRFWGQVGVGFASMIGGLIACVLLVALAILGAAFIHAHFR